MGCKHLPLLPLFCVYFLSELGGSRARSKIIIGGRESELEKRFKDLKNQRRLDLAAELYDKFNKTHKLVFYNRYLRDRIDNMAEADLWTAGHYIAAHKYYGYDARYARGTIYKEDLVFYKKFAMLDYRDFDPDVKWACEKTVLACIEKVKQVALKSDTLQFLFNSTRNRSEPFKSEYDVFRFRQTASYYLCWFTLRGEPYMKYTNPEESCLSHLSRTPDRFRHGFKTVYDHRQRYQYYKNRPFTCSKLWFCPDPCYGRQNYGNVPSEVMRFPKKDEGNPCRHLIHAWCEWKTGGDVNLRDLIRNRMNQTCDCSTTFSGFFYNLKYRWCVDKDECFDGTYTCGKDFVCRNTIGSYVCDCRRGYHLDPKSRRCKPSPILAFRGQFIKTKGFKEGDPLETEVEGFFESLLILFGTGSRIRGSVCCILAVVMVCLFITNTEHF